MSNAQEEQIRDYVSTLREMNRHEDGLLSQRLTWMWTLQGLLFGGASLLWGRDWRSVVLIGCIGLLSCLSIGYSMARGLRAMHEFRALDDIQRESLPEGSILAPAIGAVRKPKLWWLLPGYFLPWVFGIGWILIVTVRLLHPSAVP